MALDFETFQMRYLDSLGPGDEVFHGQLFPGVYPDDKRAHYHATRRLEFPADLQGKWKHDVQIIGKTVQRGAIVDRLRTLPAITNKTRIADIQGIIDLAHMTAEAGETVRVSLFEPQLGRLALQGTVYRDFRYKLIASEPKADLWSLRAAQARTEEPDAIARISYLAGEFEGYDVHQNPTRSLIRYEHFWRSVFGSNEHSVPLEYWRQLYD